MNAREALRETGRLEGRKATSRRRKSRLPYLIRIFNNKNGGRKKTRRTTTQTLTAAWTCTSRLDGRGTRPPISPCGAAGKVAGGVAGERAPHRHCKAERAGGEGESKELGAPLTAHLLVSLPVHRLQAPQPGHHRRCFLRCRGATRHARASHDPIPRASRGRRGCGGECIAVGLQEIHLLLGCVYGEGELPHASLSAQVQEGVRE